MTMGLAIILFSLLPALLYSFIIYLTVPYKTIKFKQAVPYIFVGFMSVALLKYFWLIYPDWFQLTINWMGQPDESPFKFMHAFYFVQVGLIEELAKLGIFLLYEGYRRRTQKVKDHPISTMFFVAMVSLGFAVIENIQYGTMSRDPMDTLWWRSITAVVAHMVFGLFMGYWIAIGRLGPRRYDRSLLDILINKKKKIRTFFYTIVGLVAATILHGIYDLHIELNGAAGITGLYMLLMVSLLGAFWCFRNLNELYKRKQISLKNKANKLDS